MHHMTLVSFRLLRKNLGNLREFLGEWFTATPGKKLPVRLWSLSLSSSFLELPNIRELLASTSTAMTTLQVYQEFDWLNEEKFRTSSC